MLLNFIQYIGQSPQQRTIRPTMSGVLRLRNPKPDLARGNFLDLTPQRIAIVHYEGRRKESWSTCWYSRKTKYTKCLHAKQREVNKGTKWRSPSKESNTLLRIYL